MRLSLPDAGANATLAAVVLGAVLATVSGVLANLLEAFLRRRERERWAALLFGGVLSGLKVIMEGADAARGRGEPYGPVTRRMLYAARRELDIYDRNREALMELRDAGLRAEMHSLAVRLAMPLDGLIESFTAGAGGDDVVRDRAFAFILELLEQIPPMTARLGRIARVRFDHYDAMPRPGVRQTPAHDPTTVA